MIIILDEYLDNKKLSLLTKFKYGTCLFFKVKLIPFSNFQNSIVLKKKEIL